MIEIPVHNESGEQVGNLQLDETQLGGEVRPGLLKQAYVRFHANRRQGSAATKSRGMVSGSTRKLYKQKGTGHARRGQVRTNVMRGGGVAFAKRPKSWRQGMPKKMRRLANRNALLAKAVDQEIRLVDKFTIDKPSTKQFAGLLDNLAIDRSCLVALSQTNSPVARSAANIDGVSLTRVDQLNAFDLLNHRYLLVEKEALESWLSGPSFNDVREWKEAAPGEVPAGTGEIAPSAEAAVGAEHVAEASMAADAEAGQSAKDGGE